MQVHKPTLILKSAGTEANNAHHKHCEGVVIDLIRAELQLSQRERQRFEYHICLWSGIVWLLVCARNFVDTSAATGTGKMSISTVHVTRA